MKYTHKHLLLVTLTGLLSIPVLVLMGTSISWWIASIVVYFLFSCLGITVTFHRYLAHRSFEFKWPWLRRLCILLGTLGGTGGPIDWVAVHKAHHKHSDDPEKDPHGPHLGWRHFFPVYDHDFSLRSVKSLFADRYIRFLHEHSFSVILGYWILLLVLGGVGAVFFLGLIPQAMTATFSILCNYFPHKTGYRNYETDDHSFNTWWLALPTWGDAWHNNHHAKPYRSSFSDRWWEIDLSGLVIKAISK